MISFFRRTLASRLALGLLALIMVAFILTGVFTHELPGASSVRGGGGGETLAKVGDTAITVPEMDERVRREFARYAQQQPGLDMAAFIAGGGYDLVIDQAIAATAIEALGRKLGLAASRRQVDGQIAAISAFQGPTGKFDPLIFRTALAQQHIPETKLRADIASDIVRQMVFLPATGALALPDGLVRPYAGLLVEQRRGTIGFVPAQAFAGGAAPSEAELRLFYQAHLAVYKLPERRVLRYAMIGRDQVAAGATPSEAEIRKVFDAAPQRFAARETRTLSQVVLDSQAKADAFAAQVKGGKGFAAAAAAAGFAPSDIAIGKKSQAEFAAQSEPAVAVAAFAVSAGGITAPVKSDFGWHVVKVEAVERIPATPFETARPQIAGDLAKQKQDAALGALIGRVQDALDKGRSFADVAKANALEPVETPPVTQAGLSPDAPAFKAPREVQALLKPGFAATPDDAPTVETVIPNERFALLAIGHVLPAAPIPFAQARARVASDFAAVRASDRAKAAAQALLAKVKTGTTMAAAFKASPVTLPEPRQGTGRRMDLARAQKVPASLKALFSMPAGQVRLIQGEGGSGWYVVQLQTIVPADPKLLPPLVAASRADLAQSLADDYVQQLAHGAERLVGLTRDERAIAALRAKLLGHTPTAP